MSDRKQIFHHMGSKEEIFIYKNADGTLTLRRENEGVRVLRDGVNPVEVSVTEDELYERFKNNSLWQEIKTAIDDNK
ncbi:hypothetical protein [Emcibacter nanhaiensis]|uniref:Uncharacterized protein n=1 Tax=Emcibacter nanhaiensis TaxID=1505037 RepID=A0A501PBE1_9PROT|nr:hypothetical protein [Emcibacter nanhaiensis]TPD57296.1 hypothetical protein FIV46_14300 [Emcibacter nanhaiensis]